MLIVANQITTEMPVLENVFLPFHFLPSVYEKEP